MSGLRLSCHVPPLLAVQFLTRLPVPRSLAAMDAAQLREGLRRAVIWFPMVGGLIGAIDAAVLIACEAFWPRTVAVIVMLVVEARLTGAFHEDAVADFCDGMGGGHTPEHVREIMKDSRIGTYGSVGLMLAVGLRATLLIAMPAALLVPAIVASAALGRWLAVLAIAAIPPLDHGPSLAKDLGRRPTPVVAFMASALTLPWLIPLSWVEPIRIMLALGLCGLFLIWLRAFLLPRLGGVSGDCLGLAVYAGQLILLLCALATWAG